MSFGAPAPDDQQPADFAFTDDNMRRAKQIMARYPNGKQQSAIIPLLDLAQRQNENWLPRAAMDYVADLLEVPRIRAYEVASFYTMFNKAAVGRNLVQVCTTTPCWLCGSGDVLKAIDDKLGLKPGQSSDDGQWTVVEVECLGACVNAPMVQVNDDYFEDLNYERMSGLIDQLSNGGKPTIGSQTGRQGSMADEGPTTMKDQWPSKPATKGELERPVSAAPYEAPPMPSDDVAVDEQEIADQTENPEASPENVNPQEKARPKARAKAPGKQSSGSDPKKAPKEGKKGAGKGVVEEGAKEAGKAESGSGKKPSSTNRSTNRSSSKSAKGASGKAGSGKKG